MFVLQILNFVLGLQMLPLFDYGADLYISIEGFVGLYFFIFILLYSRALVYFILRSLEWFNAYCLLIVRLSILNIYQVLLFELFVLVGWQIDDQLVLATLILLHRLDVFRFILEV
jgi:hypothetical protein